MTNAHVTNNKNDEIILIKRDSDDTKHVVIYADASISNYSQDGIEFKLILK